MSVFIVLLKKELRELITPMVFVPLILTMGIFYSIGKISSSETERLQGQATQVTVINEDQSAVADTLVAALDESMFSVTALTAGTTIDEALSHARDNQSVALLRIPAGFGEAMISENPKVVDLYTILRSLSVSGTSEKAKLDGVCAGKCISKRSADSSKLQP